LEPVPKLTWTLAVLASIQISTRNHDKENYCIQVGGGGGLQRHFIYIEAANRFEDAASCFVVEAMKFQCPIIFYKSGS